MKDGDYSKTKQKNLKFDSIEASILLYLFSSEFGQQYIAEMVILTADKILICLNEKLAGKIQKTA